MSDELGERPPARYVLNVNPGQDVLHRDPGEACNADDSKDAKAIDAETADALLTMGEARRCEHCWPEG